MIRGMKKLGVAAAIAGALLLTGCTSAEPAPVETVTVTPEAVAPVETPEPVAAPLEAPTAAPAVAGSAEYVAAVRERGLNLESYTDEQLVAAGQLACDYYRQGQTKLDIRVIEGEQVDEATGYFRNSLAIATWAAKIYCPEFDS